MDAIFDASFVVPAVIFTFLAIILATSLFGKKADPKSEAIVDDAPVEETAREGEQLQRKVGKHEVSQSEVHRVEEITAEPESDVPTVAPVEEMGALEKEPVIQAEIPPAQQESEKSQITESVAEVMKVSETLLAASRILESEPPSLEKVIIPEPMNLAPQVGFAPAPKPVPVLEAASEPEPVPEALAEVELVAQVVHERKHLPEVASAAAPEPASIPEATPTAAPKPASIIEAIHVAAPEPASIPEATPMGAPEPASIIEAIHVAAPEPASIHVAAPEPIPEATPTAAPEPASIPTAAPEPAPTPEVTPTAAPEPTSIPEATHVAASESASIPKTAPEEVSIFEASPKVASAQESVPKAFPTDSVLEPILDPLSKTATSISEHVPESAPAVASLEDVLQMAGEPGPVKEEHIDAVVPSSSEGDGEPLKYVSRKLRTSQLEKLMTKEELEEEQRRWSPLGYQNVHSRLYTAPQKEGWPTCSLRWAATRHVAHVKPLNFSVPVLTTASDLHPSVFGRLKSHPLPYGWKDVPEETITEAVRLLNNSWNSRLFERASLTCARCAVVGNGGILNGSGQGMAIDSHHYVFRVNGAVTKGFEKDVGTKTSFYGFSTNTMKNSLSAYYDAGFREIPQGQDVRYVFIPAHSRDYLMLAAAIKGTSVTSGPDQYDHPSHYFGDNQGANHFKILSPEFIRYIKDEFLNSTHMIDYPDVYIPSTGALMLMTALHMCDQVSAYGFITENYMEFSDHYYDAIKQPVELYANHDIIMESQLWAALHAQKVMQLYQRP